MVKQTHLRIGFKLQIFVMLLKEWLDVLCYQECPELVSRSSPSNPDIMAGPGTFTSSNAFVYWVGFELSPLFKHHCFNISFI